MPVRDRRGTPPREAGWYPDPDGQKSTLRFADGLHWTEQTKPLTPPPTEPPRNGGGSPPPRPQHPSGAEAAKKSSTLVVLAWLVGLTALIGAVADAANGGTGEHGFLLGLLGGLFLWALICHPGKVAGTVAVLVVVGCAIAFLHWLWLLLFAPLGPIAVRVVGGDGSSNYSA